MDCENCKGNGEVNVVPVQQYGPQNQPCFECDGTGSKCDKCGESCDTGASYCDDCMAEMEELKKI